MSGRSMADVAERLMAEFEDRLGLAEVSAVVCSAARALTGKSPDLFAGMLERTARHQLLARLTSTQSPNRE